MINTRTIAKKVAASYLFGSLLCLTLFFPVQAQDQNGDDLIDTIKNALKTGSSRELSHYFNEVIELKTDTPKKNVSKTQAEFILKDFFKKNPPNGFEVIHLGTSEQGMRYMIGKYTCHNNSTSYRVYTVIKKSGENHLIHKLEFTRE